MIPLREGLKKPSNFRNTLQVIVYDLLVVGIGVLLISSVLMTLLSQSSGDNESVNTQSS